MEQDPEKLFPRIQRVNELLGANEKRLVPTSTQNVAIPSLGVDWKSPLHISPPRPFGRRSLVQPMNGNVPHRRPPMADDTSPSTKNLKFPALVLRRREMLFVP